MTGAYGEKPAPVRAARVAMPSGKAPGFTGVGARGVGVQTRIASGRLAAESGAVFKVDGGG